MGRPRKDAFDEDTTVRVLRAAEDVFGERGYMAARLEDIAALASIKRSSLLYHFGSKDALYTRVLERAFSEMTAAATRGFARGDDYSSKVHETIVELLSFEQEHRSLMAVALRAMIDPTTPSHARIIDDFAAVVDGLEAMVVTAGGERVAPLPVRAIVMQLIVSHLARAAMGEVGERLWGGDNRTRAIAGMLLLGEAPTPPQREP